jgi:spermidine synthase
MRQDGPRLRVTIGDGIAAVTRAAAQCAAVAAGDDNNGKSSQLDLLVVDADSQEPGVAMTCPPPPFLAPPFLEAARQLLAPGGLLAINCVTGALHLFLSAFEWLCFKLSDAYAAEPAALGLLLLVQQVCMLCVDRPWL